MCLQIAGEKLSWYRFEGRKATNNGDLHITSSNFDEPQCLKLIGASRRVLTVHGDAGEADVAYVGGLHRPTIVALQVTLKAAGSRYASTATQICRAGTHATFAIWASSVKEYNLRRRTLFVGLSREERQRATERLERFCEAVRRALEMAPV